ncbi:MAG: ORF6N domain-containing protein [Bacteroidales bacterium]|nr:ORF6N domain-containing protein [Bacteroidales bacterium]
MEKEIILTDNSIQDIIYDIRGVKVMLDYDLAAIYGVETRSLNQAVKRNIERFPPDFMFKLTEEEWLVLVQKISMSSQIVMTYPEKRPKKAIPYAFTEHGAVMLASVLRSPSAVKMSVMVTRAFIAMRQALSSMLSYDLQIEQLSHKIDQLNAHVEEILHNQNDINQLQSLYNSEVAIQIEVINDALDQLREKKAKPDNPIGFKVQRQE